MIGQPIVIKRHATPWPRLQDEIFAWKLELKALFRHALVVLVSAIIAIPANIFEGGTLFNLNTDTNFPIRASNYAREQLICN